MIFNQVIFHSYDDQEPYGGTVSSNNSRRITLKQLVWQLMLRSSIEILASLPTGSPQYVQIDDSGPLEMQSHDD